MNGWGGMRDAIHRDLALLHRFEQGCLGLGRGAVDLVRQDDLPHDGSRAELELTLLLVEDRNARHIAGEHVGRELDAVEGAIQGFGQTARQHGLPHARHILDQYMSLA
jgi:hypothetical protein